jgi:hypothetical protein
MVVTPKFGGGARTVSPDGLRNATWALHAMESVIKRDKKMIFKSILVSVFEAMKYLR